MAKIKQIICISLLIFGISINLNAQEIIVGAERTNLYLPLIENKNIAIVANQSSMIKETHLIDSLSALNINIKTIFSPEHGFRGEKDAGENISNSIDKKTGIPIISLYGKNKQPTKDQLSNIDIIIFDIQDVGARFYTYISTLHYIMEACARYNIHLIILDRPNPNGHYVDGPILKKEYSSFVGMHSVPIVHGMTIGEYAQMINGENWIVKECILSIIQMKNYNHNKHYTLPVKPSPNLPNNKSINLYPSLCLFEGTNVSVGRGTDYPFQHYGSPYIKSSYLFIPERKKGSKNPKHKGVKCFGHDLRYLEIHLDKINLTWIINAYKETQKKEDFFNSFFDKLAGTDKLRLSIIEGKTEKEIRKEWKEELSKFKKVRKKYLLYK